jgi:hypothetical protein
MATYKCKNFGSCSRADTGVETSLAAGTDDKCPECGSTFVRLGEEDASAGSDVGRSKRKPVLVASAAGALILIIVGVGYLKWGGGQVVVLKPDASQASVTTASSPQLPASMVAPTEKPAPMVANEQAARKTCDEAIKGKLPDAEKICRRAAAVTLMNAGALSAVDGKLDQAEKDYSAAKDKDPDFPELYFNLAVLKARQNKGSEAVDNLTLASAKGFKQYSAIKSEPALQKLKSDPALKLKIEAFEAK